MSADAIKQKLLLIGNHPPPYGGISIHVQQLKSRFEKREDRTACVLDVQPGTRGSKGDAVVPTGELGFLRDLLHLISRATCVHVHANGQNFKSWLIVALSAWGAKLCKRRSLVTIHSGDSPEYIEGMGLFERFFLFRSLFLYDKVVVVNERIRDFLSGYGGLCGKLIVVPAYLGLSSDLRPVSDELKAFLQNHKVVFSTIVAFRPEYGIGTILDFMKKWTVEQPEAGLVIIGSGAGRAALVRQLKKLQLSSSVFVATDLAPGQVYSVLDASDVFIRATHYDGDAISVREAISLGVPVVATQTDYRPEQVMTFRVDDVSDLHEKVRGAMGKSRSSLRNLKEEFSFFDTLSREYDLLHS